MTTVEVLRAARARIERGWCQHETALDADGNAVTDPSSDAAVAWCAFGAIAAPCSKITEADKALMRALGTGNPQNVIEWNDFEWRTKADVIELFDKAIALADAATSRDAAGMKR